MVSGNIMKLGPYESGNILCGDCREILPLLPDKCVTLAFADPPYWVGFDYDGKKDSGIDYKVF